MEIRGVWITTTNSTVLDKRENIAEAMKFLAKTGFNVVFPVVWNQGFTNYPSQVMKKIFGENREINPRFIDKERKIRDPLKELIAEAKKVDIAVIPWFEYGFKSSYGQNGGEIIKTKSEWAAINYAGEKLKVNDFYWLNSLDREVQDFLLSLFLEVVKNYGDGIAGIQGDDNFLALPMEGGYDKKTIERYQQEFNQLPPKPPERGNPKDPLWQDKLWIEQWKQWLKWRADILSHFFNRFYREIIKVNPELIISMSPSIYPWGYENYLQDSQTWVDWGLVDLIHPQVYREKIEDYQRDIDKVSREQFTQKQLPQLITGVLINKKGTYQINPENLITVIKTNRCLGIQGEVFFFYEGLRENNDALANSLKSSVYSQPPGKFDAKAIKNNTFTQRRINNFTYINTSQTQEIAPEFPFDLFDWIEPFSEGIAAVKIGNKWGYIDKKGKIIGRIEYDTTEPFSEGLALVKIYNQKNSYIGYFDKTGQRITKSKFDDALSFSEGIAAVKIGNQWGFIEPTHNMIIPAKFAEAKSFSQNLAAVKIADKWGYVDKKGQTLIPSQFDDAGSFSTGLAAVKVGNQWGFIDKSSNFVIKPQFD